MKLTSINIVMIFAIALISIMAIASITRSVEETNVELIPQDSTYWIPTEEDIAYQDSMWIIIDETKKDVDTLKESIDHIIERLDEIDQ